MPEPQLDDPTLTLDAMMRIWPETIPVFRRYNMLCIGCLIGPFHTVVDACREHHCNEVSFWSDLHNAVNSARNLRAT